MQAGRENYGSIEASRRAAGKEVASLYLLLHAVRLDTFSSTRLGATRHAESCENQKATCGGRETRRLRANKKKPSLQMRAPVEECQPRHIPLVAPPVKTGSLASPILRLAYWRAGVQRKRGLGFDSCCSAPAECQNKAFGRRDARRDAALFLSVLQLHVMRTNKLPTNGNTLTRARRTSRNVLLLLLEVLIRFWICGSKFASGNQRIHFHNNCLSPCFFLNRTQFTSHRNL